MVITRGHRSHPERRTELSELIWDGQNNTGVRHPSSLSKKNKAALFLRIPVSKNGFSGVLDAFDRFGDGDFQMLQQIHFSEASFAGVQNHLMINV